MRDPRGWGGRLAMPERPVQEQFRDLSLVIEELPHHLEVPGHDS
jgi:hypothetical protein